MSTVYLSSIYNYDICELVFFFYKCTCSLQILRSIIRTIKQGYNSKFGMRSDVKARQYSFFPSSLFAPINIFAGRLSVRQVSVEKVIEYGTG